jgi:transglutaminase-like putative cysteine protease/Flp pilus assembly protein TadD
METLLRKTLLRTFALTVLLCPAWVAGAQLEVPPWERQPLAANPAAVVKAAANLPKRPDADCQMLFEEGRYRFASQGGRDFYYYRVWRILTEEGARDSTKTGFSWEPWHQARPSLRARVITPDGVAHVLDAATIEDSGPAPAEDMYTDARRLRAPLPAITVGAIVEVEVQVHDTSPFFTEGQTEAFYFGDRWPVEHTRLFIDAPVSLPLRWVQHKLEAVKPQRRTVDGRVEVTFESGPLAAIAPLPAGAPPEMLAWPGVVVSTGKSWAEVAGAYSRIAEAQLGKSDRAELERLARSAIGEAHSSDARQLATALLGLVHREVRYTGVEFGQSSIVPRAPSETLNRRYGDCKDQALLLVGLLRAVGVPARLALLRAGSGPDVEPTLPGMSFNHAIVYIPALGKAAPIWIDPTNEWARPNELPISDQGRWALVASANTRALERTPTYTLGTNYTAETREFFLSEQGHARVIETTERYGSHERSSRRYWANIEPKKAEEAFDRYVREEYLAKRLVSVEHGDVHRLDTPFKQRLEAEDARRGWSEDAGAGVAILPSRLLQNLPEPLLEADDKKRHREVDYFVSEPFVCEWRYHIVPPPGFAAKPLPASEVTPIGPFKLAKTFTVDASGAVSALLRLETSKVRLSPAEVEAVYRAYRATQDSGAIMIKFAQTGTAHLEAGRIREALLEFRRLVALHPKEALHHMQVARALVRAGLGEAARVEIARAIALEPDNGKAHYLRGWILEHDLLGRRFAKGFDRAGAEAELRRAKQLDPNDDTTRGDLAILLEHDADGDRYSSRARLDQAIAEYRAMGKDAAKQGIGDNLLFCLAWKGSWKELVEEARKRPSSAARDQLLLVGIAAANGAPAALAEATSIEEQRRRVSVQGAAEFLVKLRLYAQAADLLEESSRGADAAAELRARVDVLRHLRRFDGSPLADSDPTSPVRQLLIEFVAAHDNQRLLGLFAEPLGWEPFIGVARRVSRTMTKRYANVMTPAVLSDIISSLLTVRKEGDGRAGYLVHAEPTAGFAGNFSSSYVVVRKNGQYRIGTILPEVAPLGRLALDAADAGGARDLLGWAARLAPPADSADPQGTSPFLRIWTGGDSSSPGRLRLAAASLAATGTPGDAKIALPLLRAALKGSLDERDHDAIVLAMLTAHLNLDQAAEALALLEPLAARQPASHRLFDAQVDCLFRLRRFTDIRRLATLKLEQVHDDIPALRALARADEAEQKWESFDRSLRRVLELGQGGAGDYNELAWDALFHGKLGTQAVEDARRAVELSGRQEPGVLHTLATIYAELGRANDARDILLEGIELNGGETRSEDYYVLGRIAESYGESEAALADYRRVALSPKLLPHISPYALAQQRIQALAQSPAGAGAIDSRGALVPK